MSGCYYGYNDSMTVIDCRNPKVCASYKFESKSTMFFRNKSKEICLNRRAKECQL